MGFSVWSFGEVVAWVKPCPFAASALLASPGDTAANSSLNLPQVQSVAVAQASVWTETGPLGLFETTFHQAGDQRATWGKRMFFRLQSQ